MTKKHQIPIADGSRHGPPKIYCPTCEEFNSARAMRIPHSLAGGARQFYSSHDPDIAWYRRKRVCESCQTGFLTAEVDESLLNELLRFREQDTKRRRRTFAKVGSTLRANRKWLDKTGDDVPLDLARQLVADSAWWLTHSSGSPVRAPRHAERLEKLYCGWSVEFGANWFAAARALASARDYANKVISLAGEGKLPSKQAIRRNIREIPSACVLNVNRDFYDYYPQNEVSELVFGAQAIDVNDCEKVLMRVTGLDDLIAEYTRVKAGK